MIQFDEIKCISEKRMRHKKISTYKISTRITKKFLKRIMRSFSHDQHTLPILTFNYNYLIPTNLSQWPSSLQNKKKKKKKKNARAMLIKHCCYNSELDLWRFNWSYPDYGIGSWLQAFASVAAVMKSLTNLVARNRPVNRIGIDYQEAQRGTKPARSAIPLQASYTFCFDFLNSVTGRSNANGSIADVKCYRPSVRETGVRTICSQSIRRVSRAHVA